MSTYIYFPTVPAASNDPGDDQSSMLINSSSIAGLITEDHIGFNVTNGGTHKQIRFGSNNVPSLPTTIPTLFTDTVAGLPQLKFFSGDAAHSSAQYIAGGAGSTFCLGGIIMKWIQVSVSGAGGTFTFAGSGVSNFPNNAYLAFLTPGSTGYTLSASSLNNTQVVIGKNPSAGSVAVNVLVIGN